MEYRTTVPDDHEDADDEFAGMSDYVHELMGQSSSVDIMDTLLIITNICETRAILHAPDRSASVWYTNLGNHIRDLLGRVTVESEFALPNAALENPLLYYPVPETTH